METKSNLALTAEDKVDESKLGWLFDFSVSLYFSSSLCKDLKNWQEMKPETHDTFLFQCQNIQFQTSFCLVCGKFTLFERTSDIGSSTDKKILCNDVIHELRTARKKMETKTKM